MIYNGYIAWIIPIALAHRLTPEAISVKPMHTVALPRPMTPIGSNLSIFYDPFNSHIGCFTMNGTLIGRAWWLWIVGGVWPVVQSVGEKKHYTGTDEQAYYYTDCEVVRSRFLTTHEWNQGTTDWRHWCCSQSPKCFARFSHTVDNTCPQTKNMITIILQRQLCGSGRGAGGTQPQQSIWAFTSCEHSHG